MSLENQHVLDLDTVKRHTRFLRVIHRYPMRSIDCQPVRSMSRLFMCALAGIALVSCATTPWYDTPPRMPVVITPEVGVPFLSGENVTFVWSSSDTAEHYDFHLFNATNSDIDEYFNRDLDPASVCDGDTCSITLTVRLPESDRHAWRVRAGNVAGNSSWTRTLISIVPSIDSSTIK